MRTPKQILFFQILILAFSLAYLSCKAPVKNEEEFQFPKIDWIDPTVYNEIKKTCRSRWDLNNMIDDSFEVRKKEGIGYVIECDGYFEGTIWRFYILVDENGQWLNNGIALNNP